MTDRIAPPPPPEKNLEVFKARLEYYQQLKEYHRQQMVLAQEKFARLKAFLELELSLESDAPTSGIDQVELVKDGTETKISSDLPNNQNSVPINLNDRPSDGDTSTSDSDRAHDSIKSFSNYNKAIDNSSYILIDTLENNGLQTIETKDISPATPQPSPNKKVDDDARSSMDVKNTPLYELIASALRSVAPQTMNADDIVNWIYPQGVSSRIWKKTRNSVASALSNHLSKNLWEREKLGYYRSKPEESELNNSQPEKNKNDRTTHSDSSEDFESNDNNSLSNDDLQREVFATIKKLGGYAAVVRAAMPTRVNLITTSDDICDWLELDLSESLKQKLAPKFKQELARGAKKGKWQRIDTLTYKYSSQTPIRTANEISNQTTLELTSTSTKVRTDPANNLQKKPTITQQLEELFKIEGNAQILHHNYIANKIFGSNNYRDRLPQLLEMLALGQKQNLWARVPEDPDCWTLDLSLLPTEEIEVIEEDSSTEPTLQPT